MAIEQDQALDLKRLFGGVCLSLVVDGKNNTPEVRHSIITGDYTHIRVSAGVALGELVPGKGLTNRLVDERSSELNLEWLSLHLRVVSDAKYVTHSISG
jgi:hypothetical protein